MKKYALFLLSLFTLTTCETDDDITLQYELKTSCVPVEGGTIEPGPGMFNEGSKIDVTAVPTENYVFKNWSGCVSGNENPTSIEMTQNRSVTAVFEKLSFPLSIEVEGQGHVKQEIIVNKSVIDYPVGTKIQLTAVPEDGWHFDGWEGDHIGNENPIIIEMDKSMSLTVIFKENEGERTFIPDDKFEQALIDRGYDDKMDNYVLTENINQLEELELYNLGIEDLIGIEGFAGLKTLNCSKNQIHNLDLSGNTHLGHLIAENNKIEMINFSENSDLFALELKGNNLSQIDLSKTKSLILLDVTDNELESLDISNVNLWTLYATNNKLTCISVNKIHLDIIDRFLSCTTIDYCWVVDEDVEFALDCGVSNEYRIYVPDDNFEQALIDLGLDNVLDDYVSQTSIENVYELRLGNKQISDLTGIEGFVELGTLVLTNNNLTSIDISENRYLQTLICDNNLLTHLDLSQNVPLSNVNVKGNPLSCINISPVQLYDGGFGPRGDWLIMDEGVSASVDCSVTEEDMIYIPGDAFEQALIDLGFDDVLDDYVQSIKVINVFDLDLSGRNISDLTGIEGFQGLLILDVSNNELASLDISGINFYYQIDVRENPLTCVQVNEWQLSSLGGGVSFIWRDDGVEFSLDCGY